MIIVCGYLIIITVIIITPIVIVVMTYDECT